MFKKPNDSLTHFECLRFPTMSLTALQRSSAYLRPVCRATITPQTVVLEVGGRVRVHRRSNGADDGFDAAVSDLLQLIDEAGIRGRHLKLLVSDHWARPAVLTLPGASARDEGIETMLANHYRLTYGDLMTGWRWCWHLHGSRLLALAWPGAGLLALTEGLTQRYCTLASARSMGMEVACCLPVEPGACWLAITMPTCITLIRQQDGVLQHWSVVTDDAPVSTTLPLLLGREAVRRSDACRSVLIVDFNAILDMATLRHHLLTVGWASRVCTANALAGSLAWRLHQGGLAQKSV